MELLAHIWKASGIFLGAVMTIIGIVTAGHALINKRDPKDAFGWIIVCIVFPLIGPALYFFFGINRVEKRAKKMFTAFSPPSYDSREFENQQTELFDGSLPVLYEPQMAVSDLISQFPVCHGNRVSLLQDGNAAYPAMLQAINSAQSTVYLTTYIFDVDDAGEQFVHALEDAHKRGVRVRILIDGIGEMNWRKRASTHLQKRGLTVARHIPPQLFPPTIYINLRNHRKILLVDGRTAFTGGMNITNRHLILPAGDQKRQASDMHFMIEGPLIRQIENVFCDDWLFTTGESLPRTTVMPEEAGSTSCRVIADGPDEEMDKLYMILSSAISAAKHHVCIMTPYFLPPRGLISILQVTALRGVRFDIILPEKSDAIFVHWATRNILWELLLYGVHVYYQPPPFAHTKLVLVDDHYAQIGSANMDSRSLRLNFELNVEMYDPLVAKMIREYFLAVQSRCRSISFAEVENRPLGERLRDSFAWLFSSYL
jgi:cardiolipin synthase